MIDLIVVRGDGDKTGPDIEDPLISTTEVALARGRNEIDANSGLQSVVLVSKYRTGLRLGQVVAVMDALQGETWVGKLAGIAHRAEGPQLLSELTIERRVT